MLEVREGSLETNEEGSLTFRRGGWLQTFTGKKFWPLDPRFEEIYIQDIAAALSKICRFGGHTLVFYSVGQHCVLGSHIVEARTKDKNQALAFLLHDASEAYLGDLIRPLKHLPEFAFYREAEKRIEALIEKKYVVDLSNPLIKGIDDYLLFSEKKDFLGPGPEWNSSFNSSGCTLEIPLTPWSWEDTMQAYLARFEELT